MKTGKEIAFLEYLRERNLQGQHDVIKILSDFSDRWTNDENFYKEYKDGKDIQDKD